MAGLYDYVAKLQLNLTKHKGVPYIWKKKLYKNWLLWMERRSDGLENDVRACVTLDTFDSDGL